MWVVSSYADASIFDESLHSMQSQSSARRGKGHGPDFSYALFVTNSRTEGRPLIDRLEEGDTSNKLSPLTKQKSKAKDSKSKMTEGRPDLQAEIMALAPWGMEAVVFACGPTALQNLCAEYAGKAKVDLRTESFEL